MDHSSPGLSHSLLDPLKVRPGSPSSMTNTILLSKRPFPSLVVDGKNSWVEEKEREKAPPRSWKLGKRFGGLRCLWFLPDLVRDGRPFGSSGHPLVPFPYHSETPYSPGGARRRQEKEGAARG